MGQAQSIDGIPKNPKMAVNKKQVRLILPPLPKGSIVNICHSLMTETPTEPVQAGQPNSPMKR
jgi:hypothetical protein